VSDEELVAGRVEQYLKDRRAFELEVSRLLKADGRRDMGVYVATQKREAELAVAWERRKTPHVTPDHEAGPVHLGVVPEVDWESTRIITIDVKGSVATIVTEEAIPQAEIAAIIGPETLEYRLRRVDGEWRIHARWLLNRDPPPKWIRGLL
jgi:hypothetical protein